MARAPSVIMTAADKKAQIKEIKAQLKANEKELKRLNKEQDKLLAQLDKLDPPAPTAPANVE